VTVEPESLLAHRDFVRALARQLVLDEPSADDVIQQTWLAALEHPPRSTGSLRAWLGQVAQNFALMTRRADRKRSRREEAAAAPEAVPSAADIYQREAVRRRVIVEVLALDRPYRDAILLRFFEDLPPREIAARLRIPVESAKSRLKRGLASLRERLDAAHDGGRGSWRAALAPLARPSVASRGAPPAGAPSSAILGVLTMTAKLKIGVAVTLFVGAAFVLWQTLEGHRQTPAEPGLSRPAGASFPGAAAPPESPAPTKVDPGRDRTAQEESSRSLEFRGKVLSRERGDGIEGALVAVDRLPRPEHGAGTQTRTSPDGSFCVRRPRDAGPGAASFFVRISAKGFKRFETEMPRPRTDAAPSWGAFFLEKNRFHTIRVVDANGKPVAGARLSLFKRDLDSPFVEQSADANGLISIPDQDVERTVWLLTDVALRVSATGLADSYRRMDKDRTDPFPEKVIMKAAGLWLGKVVDAETGAPIPGARVRIEPPLFRAAFPGSDSFRTRSAETGSFRLPRFTVAEDPTAHVSAAGYLGLTSPVDVGQPLRFALKRAALSRRVLVIDAATGLPIPDLDLDVYCGTWRQARTDASGYFPCCFPEARETRVVVLAEGYDGASYPSLDPADIDRGRFAVRLTALLRDRLKITVRDELDRPVAGADARLILETSAGDKRLRQFTDRMGVAVFDVAVATRTRATVILTRFDYCSHTSPPFWLGPGEIAPGPFVLKKGIVYQRIKVVDEKGKPAPRKTVVARLDLEDGRTALSAERPTLAVCAAWPFRRSRKGRSSSTTILTPSAASTTRRC